MQLFFFPFLSFFLFSIKEESHRFVFLFYWVFEVIFFLKCFFFFNMCAGDTASEYVCKNLHLRFGEFVDEIGALRSLASLCVANSVIVCVLCFVCVLCGHTHCRACGRIW